MPADMKEQSGVLAGYDSAKHIATVQTTGKPDRLIEVVGKALNFIKSKKMGATIGFHQNARGQMDAVYDAAIPAGQMPLGEGRTDQGDPEKAPNGPKDVTPAEFRKPAPASATPSPAPAQPAVTTPPLPEKAPAAAPVKRLPQDLREERICRMSCLKSAVDLLKDQPAVVTLGFEAQIVFVLDTANEFMKYVDTGETPWRDGE